MKAINEENGVAEEGAKEFEILRSKAFLRTSDDREWILQGVREVYEITEIPVSRGSKNDDEADRMEGKLLLIGRGLTHGLRERFLIALNYSGDAT